MEPPVNQPWVPPTLPSKPKPAPMFAYASLPSKHSAQYRPKTPVSLPRRPELPSKPANDTPLQSDSGHKTDEAKTSADAKFAHPAFLPCKPGAGAVSLSPASTPDPGAMVPYDAYTFMNAQKSHGPLPGIAGRADINIWSKPLREAERFEDSDTRKRERSEDDDTPAAPLSLANTQVVSAQMGKYNPDAPVPVLPPPLPSKRARKGGASTAVLLPVEKLPVFPLPPAPPINDPDLLRQVFTHHSSFPRSRGLFEGAEDQGHYEKLEHVGDSILGMVVTTWLHELKPGLTCGTATKLKAHLVSNATLSHISGMYNFPQRLNGDARLLPVLRAQTDVRAALVEAYIAGVYFSFPPEKRMVDGIKCVTAWLREMYDPLYDFFLQHMQNEYKQHYSVMGTAYDGTVQVAASPEELDKLDAIAEGMALLLKMYGTQRERKIEYESERFETSVGILWRMRCSVDGIEMGDATRSSRYRARNAAAWEAAKKLGLASS